MKKIQIIKVVTINILLLIFVFFLSDYLYFIYSYNLESGLNENYTLRKYIGVKLIHNNTYLDDIYVYNKAKYIKDLGQRRYRQPLNLKAGNVPILIFGCSYAFGYSLTEKECLSGQLAKYLPNEKIVNRALNGCSVQHMLYQLQSPLFYKFYPKSKLILYVYIPDHIRRLFEKTTSCSFTKDVMYSMI